MSILTAKFLLVRLTRRQAIESVDLGLNPDLIVYCCMVLGESSCLCLCFVLFCFVLTPSKLRTVFMTSKLSGRIFATEIVL